MLELCILILVLKAVYEILKMMNINIFAFAFKNKKFVRTARVKAAKRQRMKEQVAFNEVYFSVASRKADEVLHKNNSEKEKLTKRLPVTSKGVLHELMIPCRVDQKRTSVGRTYKERKRVA